MDLPSVCKRYKTRRPAASPWPIVASVPFVMSQRERTAWFHLQAKSEVSCYCEEAQVQVGPSHLSQQHNAEAELKASSRAWL